MSSPFPHSRKLAAGAAGARASGADAGTDGQRPATLDPGDLYDQHAKLVGRWAARLAGPGMDVEDMVHEVFLVAFRRLGEFRGDAKVSTWLYEITVRVVQDRRRSHRRWRWFAGAGAGAGAAQGMASGARSAGPGTDELASLAAHQPSPLDLLERKESSTKLYKILDGLSEKYRTTIILFELEGMSGQEIAAITGTSVSNVWIRLLRGRQQFLKRLLAWEARGKGPS